MEHEESSPNSMPVSFLPINQCRSPPGTRKRRVQQSCEQCRKRKVKCEFNETERSACRRCLRENALCEFGTDRRSNKRLATAKASAFDVAARLSMPIQTDTAEESNMVPIHEPLRVTGSSVTVTAAPGPNMEQRLVTSQVLNATDALDLITFAVGDHSPPRNGAGSFSRGLASNNPIDLRAWDNVRIVRRGTLSKDEAIEYLGFFFDQMWPLKPIVHAFYSRPSSYPILAREEPVLVTAIITLASRYHQLSGEYGDVRSERIHWQAWRALQKYLQAAMWGSRSARSQGVITSMLLLIDWHVKPINNISTFADPDVDIEDEMRSQEGVSQSPRNHAYLTSEERHGMMGLLENLNIVAPAYRSNKMSWVLLSNAIALATEACCFDPNNSDLTSDSPDSEHLEVRKDWNKILCVFIYLADEHLASRLGFQPLLSEKLRSSVHKHLSCISVQSLPNKAIWESYAELAGEARKARDILQNFRMARSETLSYHLVRELEHVRKRLDRLKLEHLMANWDNVMLGTFLSIELNYTILYSFSPVAYTNTVRPKNGHPCGSSHDGALTHETFAKQAVQASRDLLFLFVNLLSPSRVVSLLPVRLWLFITSASLHLLKSVLLNRSDPKVKDESSALLYTVVDAMQRVSPDDAHMARRFSHFLEVLLKASLKRPILEFATGTGVGINFDSPGFNSEELPPLTLCSEYFERNEESGLFNDAPLAYWEHISDIYPRGLSNSTI